jgi:5'-3' exonuclease
MKIIVDANNLGFMAHHSVGELSIQDMRTGAIFGFLRMMFAVSQRFDSNEFIFCWDSKKRYRVKQRSEYKENRRDKELTAQEKEELRVVRMQFKELRKYILPELGFKNNFMIKGFEGDDIVASIIKKYDDEIFCIMSNDNDLFQLLAGNVFMYSQTRKQKVTKKDFRTKYGISPKKWVYAKCIGGCYGDNVKGIKGASDPAKSIRSKALSYVKGELTSGIIKDRIESKEGKEIIKSNRKLIKLPHKKFPKNLELNDNEVFKKKKWIKVFDRYDFRFFLMKEQITLISQLFKLK